MRGGAQYWVSAMGTNIALAAILTAIIYFGGLKVIALVFLPTVLVAASAGVWLFFVQHQFEETHWEMGDEWQLHDAALHGSSHYVLPPVLRWFTGNIGIHHVHHLYSRIPFYRLPEVLRDHSALATANRLTLRESPVLRATAPVGRNGAATSVLCRSAQNCPDVMRLRGPGRNGRAPETSRQPIERKASGQVVNHGPVSVVLRPVDARAEPQTEGGQNRIRRRIRVAERAG